MKRTDGTGLTVRKGGGALIADPTDVVLCAAIALLPAGGTVFGFAMPYWSPISPLLFLLYAALNVRLLPWVFARYGAFLLFPLVLVAVSVYGWLTVAVNPNMAFQTLVALATGMACLASLDIAFRVKRLDWSAVITLLIAAYGVSFAIGVVQFLAVHGLDFGIVELSRYTLKRNYVPNKVQFLFAEPSYVGMHLFGVLLPLHWITGDRRLAVVAVGYAAGAAAMGAGVRILVDTVITMLLWVVVAANFRRVRTIVATAIGMMGVGVVGATVMLTNPRIQSLASDGIMNGDFSATARIFRSLAPVEAWLADIPHFLFGFGIGNLKNAIARGYRAAFDYMAAHGGNPRGNEEIRLLGTPPGDHYIFTMNAYVDFITEFGLVMFLVAIGGLLWHVTRNHTWNKTTVCWLVLMAYLYIQFEGYAFYALWLFIWVTGLRRGGRPSQGAFGQCAGNVTDTGE